MFALHVLVYQSTLERPRPEQCDGGRDVLEAGRTHVLEQASKPGRLQLEHAVGVGRLKQPERGRVVPGDLGQVESKPPGQLQVPDRVLDDRQVSQAQEIHLQESYLLYGIHLVLSHHCPLFLSVLLATGDARLERDIALQRLGSDHDARSMCRCVADQALELACVPEQALERRVFLGGGQLRDHLHRLVERHIELRRDQLGQPVDIAQRDIEGATHIADHRPGFHGAEGDDLGHVVLAVAAGHVLDHPVAVAIIEVDVDVGHRDPLAVEESLEDQAMLQRVQGRDPERVGDNAARGRPPTRPDCHAVLLRVLDEVAHDQEVGGIAHVLDDAELHLKTVTHHRRHLRIADRQPLLGELSQIALGRGPARDFEARQQWTHLQFQVAPLGYP